MAYKQKQEFYSGPESIPDVVKIIENEALIDPNKTSGRRLRRLFINFVDTMFGLIDRLTGNAIRGIDQKVRNLTRRDAIRDALLVVGLKAYVGNNATADEVAQGVDNGPAEYKLIADSQGDLTAFIDAEETTTERVAARWVRASGTNEEITGSYPLFVGANQPIKVGDIKRYTALAGRERLFQALTDQPLPGNQVYNIAPTGYSPDPNWLPFAPLDPNAPQPLQRVLRADILDQLSIGALPLLPTLYAVNWVEDEGPIIYAWSLDKTNFSGTGWMIDNTGQPVYLTINLETGDYEPIGLSTQFSSISGNPRDNAALSAALDAYNGAQKPFAVIEPSGKLSYYSAWLDMVNVPFGSEIHLRGAYGNPNMDYPALNDHKLVLEPGSVFTCRRFFAHTSGAVGPDGWRYRTIEGTGTLRGLVQWYGAPGLNLVIRDIRHEGRLEHNAFGGPAVGVLGAKLFVQNVTAAPAEGQAYFTGFHRNGGFYTSWFQADFYDCRIEANASAAFYLYSLNNDATTDTDGKANNRLRAVNCRFTGDGMNQVLNSGASGTATYQFAFNTAYNIAVPTEDLDPNFLAFGVGLNGASTPGGPTYTDEQAQDALARLLAAGTQQGIAFTYDDAGNALSATVTATGGGGSNVTVRDVYAYTQAKRTQVFGLFTTPQQFKAVDIALAGDTSTALGSRIPDLTNGDMYELIADPENPTAGPNNTTVGTPTWIRY